MARMYSRKKGKSGSTKPKVDKLQTWIKYKPAEVEQLVVKLSKAEKTPSQIGVVLRDSYGIPDVKKITKKTVVKILEENKIVPELPEDLVFLMKKEINLLKHLGKNKKDMPGKRGLQLTESKIRRLTKYYKRSGRLPKDWIYDKEKVKLLIG